MSHANDDLKRKIMSDESFNGSADEQLKTDVLRQFENRRKKVLIIAMINLLLGLYILFFGAYLMGNANHVKHIVLAGVVMLIGYETTVLIKLWYAIADFHVRSLKEIKRLELLAIAPSSTTEADATATAWTPVGKTSKWLDRVSHKTLGRISVAVLILAAVVGTTRYIVPVFNVSFDPKRVYEEHTQLAADGSSFGRSRNTYAYGGFTPLETVEIQSGNPLIDPTWRDANGNTLAHKVRQEDDGYHYTVQLPHPIFRGEFVDFRNECTFDNAARKEGDLWVFHNRRTWYSVKQVREALTFFETPTGPTLVRKTIMLPAGAELVSVEPTEKMRWKDKGRWVLYFEDAMQSGSTEEFRVTYRLPASEQPAAGS